MKIDEKQVYYTLKNLVLWARSEFSGPAWGTAASLPAGRKEFEVSFISLRLIKLRNSVNYIKSGTYLFKKGFFRLFWTVVMIIDT